MTRLPRWFAWVLLIVAFTGLPSVADASHFRFGQITWSPSGGNTVQFTVQHAWRRSICFGTAPDGFVAVGNTICGLATLNFGDATSTTITGTVVSIDVAADWFLASYTVSHTYPSATNGPNPWVASINTCCRIYALSNASGGSLLLQATVDLSVANTSPVSTIFPIVGMAANTVNTIALPVADADGDTVSCSLAGPGSGIPVQPTVGANALSVSSNCVLTWNTTGAGLGSLWATQILIQDSRGGGPLSTVPLDFIIQIVQTIGSPPVCDVPPTPTGTIIVAPGTPFAATIQGSDPDAGNTLTLNSTGIPAGATLAPGLPASSASPVSSTFAWTPGVGDIGVHLLLFSITDNFGQQALCSFTIEVPANQPPIAACHNVTVGTDAGVCTAATASINNGSSDPDGDPLTLVQTPNGPFALGVTNASLLVTDTSNASASCQATITVVDNALPVITCSAPQVIECTSPNGASALVGATAVDNCSVGPAACTPGSGIFGLGTTGVSCLATDGSGNQSSCSTTVKVVDTTAPVVSCTPSFNPSGRNTPKALNEDGFYVVGGSDVCSTSSTLAFTLGSYALAAGETIKITQAPGASGVTLLNLMGPAQIKHFRVGPGDALVVATDGAGNTSSASCLVAPPPK